MDRPVFSEYTSYRTLLAALIQHKASVRSGFSFRKLSSLAGVNSPGFFQSIIRGQRRLSLNLVPTISRIFQMSEVEEEFFKALLQYEDESDASDAALRERAVLQVRQKLCYQRTVHLQAPYLTWSSVVANELKLLNDISSGEKSSDVAVYIEPPAAENPPHPLHADTLRQWSEILPQTLRRDCHTGLLTTAVSTSQLARIRTRLAEIDAEIRGWGVESVDEPREHLIQVGLYLVPLKKEILPPEDSN